MIPRQVFLEKNSCFYTGPNFRRMGDDHSGDLRGGSRSEKTTKNGRTNSKRATKSTRREKIKGGGKDADDIQPTTGFFLWMLSGNRARIEKENPKMNLLQIGRECGKQYRELSDRHEWSEKCRKKKEAWKKVSREHPPYVLKRSS